MASCPNEHDLNRYHAGEMEPADAARIRNHLAGCKACAQRDAALVAKHDDIVQYVRELGLSDDLAELLKSSSDAAAHKAAHARQRVEVQAAPVELDIGLDVGATLPPKGVIEGYEILRELHRGGQGVVYQAVQKSTKRKVAIKVLLEGPYASRSARKRFEREIELAANLKHPNIVTVFHSGETADGRQYYVMDYVRGARLDQYVRDKQLCLEDALRLFVTICQAVNYAHQRGIIHRDLKPSNILVDAEGNPKILDFGLAKRLSGSSETLLSLTGEVVGTLPYLSPEVAKGHPDEVDIRADVYALGVILYEILTGQYPYPVAGEIIDVLRNITDADPSPPSKAWRAGSGIDRRMGARGSWRHGCPLDGEIETIILKALTKERERRYQSALELGRDIVHYLAGEPIEARRNSSWYVLRKTLGRYKLAVGVVALFALLVVGSSITLSIMYGAAVDSEREAQAQAADAKKQLERALAAEALAQQQLDRALAAEDRATHRFEQVRELANTFMFEIHHAIADLPGSTSARELLVKTALAYLESLVEEAADDPRLLRELAIAYGKVGDAQGSIRRASLGDTAGATVSYQKSLDLFEKICRTKPDDRELRLERAYAVSQVADMLWITGHTKESLVKYREVRDTAEQVLGAVSDNSRASNLFVQGCQDVADVLRTMGKPDEALEEYKRGIRVCERMLAADPTDPDARSFLALFYDKIGSLQLLQGNTDAGLDNLRESLKIREALMREMPDSVLYREFTATVYTHIGDAYDWTGRTAEALEQYRQGLEIRETLAAADATNALARRELAVAYDRTAMAEHRLGQTEAALIKLWKALELRQALVAANPSNTTWQADLAVSYGQIACLKAEAGDLPGAVENNRSALRIWEELVKTDEASAESRAGLAVACRDLGGALKQNGQVEEALACYRRGIAIRETLVKTDPDNVEFRRNLAGEYDRLGDLLMADGNSDDSAECFRKALSLAETCLSAEPDNATARRNLAVAYLKIGHCTMRMAGSDQKPAGERVRLLEEARHALQKSQDSFAALLDEGFMKSDQKSIIEELKQRIDQCDGAIKDLQAGRPTSWPVQNPPGDDQS